MRFRDPRKSESGIRASSVISSSTTFSSPRSAKSMTLCEQCLVVACKLNVQLSHKNLALCHPKHRLRTAPYKTARFRWPTKSFKGRTSDQLLSEQARIGKVGEKKHRRRIAASSSRRITHSSRHPLMAPRIHGFILPSMAGFIPSSLPRSMHSSRQPCLAPCIHRVISPLIFHYISSYHGSIHCPSSPGSSPGLSSPRDPREGPPPRDPRATLHTAISYFIICSE